jgi:hypothetical protein
MAATSKNPEIIDEIKHLVEIPVPWCDEYERMVSGMK